MSLGYRLSFDAAYDFAKNAAEVLAPTVEVLKCVGSVRRRRQTVGDIEFLARPWFTEDLLGERSPDIEPVKAALLELGTWVQGQSRALRITDLLGERGLRLELYLVHPPSAWGSQLAIRTGPGDLGKYVVTKMREFGYRHDAGHAERIDTGEIVPTDTEEQFFALAQVPCVPPHERDELAAQLWRPLRPQESHA